MYSRNRSHRWFRRGLIYVVGVLAVAVIGLVAEAALNRGPQPSRSLSQVSIPTPPWAAPTQAQATTPSLSAESRRPALTGPVQVIQGRQLINGVYLGYPHSTIGAVSAAVEFLAATDSTLDPDRAAAVMRMTADPDYPHGPQQAAEGITSVRKDLGLPANGPVPAGASFQIEPVEYQVRAVSANRVTVLLLCDFISTMPAQGTVTRIGVFPVRMHWAEGDWKILPPNAATYSSLNAEPASPQAAALGWQELDQSAPN
jgi:hypothetical protein